MLLHVDIIEYRQILLKHIVGPVSDRYLFWCLVESLKRCYGFKPTNYHRIVDQAMCEFDHYGLVDDRIDVYSDHIVYHQCQPIADYLPTMSQINLYRGGVCLIS